MSNNTKDPAVRFITVSICTSILIIFLGFAGCTVMVSLDDADEANAHAEIIKAHQLDDIAKIAAIKELIADGIDPMTARCAVYGWDDKNINEILICQGADRTVIVREENTLKTTPLSELN